MDSSFISSAQKHDYCAQLTILISRSTAANLATEPAKKEVEPKLAAEYRPRLISVVSMMLGVITVLMSLTLTLFERVRVKDIDAAIFNTGTKHTELLFPMLATVLTMTVSLIAMMLYRDLLRRKRESGVVPDLAKRIREARRRASELKES